MVSLTNRFSEEIKCADFASKTVITNSADPNEALFWASHLGLHCCLNPNDTREMFNSRE